MKRRSDPRLRSYLAAERAFYDAAMAAHQDLRTALGTEFAARLPVEDDSVAFRRGPYNYVEHMPVGAEYGQLLRQPLDGGEYTVVLDADAVAKGHDYLRYGVCQPSPDGRYIAYSVDFTGDEVYELRFRDTATGLDLPERIPHTYYGSAWSLESTVYFYVVHDHAYRPFQVYRHTIGTPFESDVLVYSEPDERYHVQLRATRSGSWIVISPESCDTNEQWLVPASSPLTPPFLIEPRRRGIEYFAEHVVGTDELVLLTNDGAPEYRVVRAPVAALGTASDAVSGTPSVTALGTAPVTALGTAPVTGPGAALGTAPVTGPGAAPVTGPGTAPGRSAWTEVVPGQPDTRLRQLDVFADHLVLRCQRDGTGVLRVIRPDGTSFEHGPPDPCGMIELDRPDPYDTTALVVSTESLIAPRRWWLIDLATGALQPLRQTRVPGYDPIAYATSRGWATAPDGSRVPVTFAYRADALHSGGSRADALHQDGDRAGALHPGGSRAGALHTGGDRADTLDPGGSRADALHPGGDRAGALESGALESGALESGALESGALDPGGSRAGALQSGSGRADALQSGGNPCVLYGYGAYERCALPRYSPVLASLLDRGYVYAIAHVRGGGEGGRRWWLDGRLANKHHTFTDFVAVRDWLVAEGWAAPDRVICRGLSAGGLLTGAAYTFWPERWAGVIAEAPAVDLLNQMLDPAVPLTINEYDEWGDPNDPEQFEWIRAYTPYENLTEAPKPPLLVTATMFDPRVAVYEPAKWVAALRAHNPHDNEILLRAELGAGAHKGPSGRRGSLAYEAEILAWILSR